MKINLKTTIKNFKGEPLQDQEKKELTLGEVLSNILISDKTGGKMKLFVLAKKFYEQDSIDLDASDLALVKNAVKTSDIYAGALVIGQVELLLNDLKE